MASWVVVQLDTIPPSLSIEATSVDPAPGQNAYLGPGQVFWFDYSASPDAQLVGGVLSLPGGIDAVGTVVGDRVSFTIPEEVPQGTAHLHAYAMDDVNNTITIDESFPFISDYVPPAVPGSGVGQTFTYGGGPWHREFKESIPATASMQRGIDVRHPAYVELLRELPVQISFSAEASLSREVKITLSGSLQPATRWNTAIEEDEILLLS